MTWTRASFHLMNSPLCQTTSQMRGVCTSFVLPSVGNMVSDSPFWRLIIRKLGDLRNGSIDKARYSKGERVCKMNHSPRYTEKPWVGARIFRSPLPLGEGQWERARSVSWRTNKRKISDDVKRTTGTEPGA